MKYDEYIQSLDWHNLSERVKKARDYTCEICGQKGKSLNVHHLAYPCDWKHDSVLNLMCVCTTCHLALHSPEKRESTTILDSSDLGVKLIVVLDMLRHQLTALHKRITVLEEGNKGSGIVINTSPKRTRQPSVTTKLKGILNRRKKRGI